MKKILFVALVCLVVLSGCTANVNVNISKNGSVKETVIIDEDSSNLEDFNKEDVINSYLSIYDEMLDGYTYKDISTDNKVRFKLEKSYDNVCKYFEESVFASNNTTNLSCKFKNNSYKIKAKVNNFTCDENCFEGSLVDGVEFDIKYDGKILNSNFDNMTDNEYKWSFSGEHNKNIKLTINGGIRFLINNILHNNLSIIFLIVFSVIIALIIIGIILYKKYMKNRIRY